MAKTEATTDFCKGRAFQGLGLRAFRGFGSFWEFGVEVL